MLRGDSNCLFIAHDGESELGGVHTWLGVLLPMLRDRGVRCSAALFIREGEGMLTRQLRETGVNTFIHSHFAPFRKRVQWLSGVISEAGATVLIPNYIVAGFSAATILRSQGIRTIAVLHSDDAFYRALIECQRNSDSAIRFDRAVPVSRFLERKVHWRLGRDFPTTRIPCGIDLNSGVSSHAPGELRLVYVGRLVQEQKRICDLADVFCRVVREIPGVKADIIGDGCDRMAAESVLVANGSPREVRILGALTPDEVRKRLPSYQVKVLLSDYEGLPVALIEAMAAGLVPVCISMRSGINELVIDRVTGLLVADRGDAFVLAIRELAASPSLWSFLSANALEQVKAFDAEACADRWTEVINEVAHIDGAEANNRRDKPKYLPQWRPEFDWDMQTKSSPLRSLLSNVFGRLSRYGKEWLSAL